MSFVTSTGSKEGLRLSGKVAIVTGGLSGIGAATVEAFLIQGAKVVVSDINEPASISSNEQCLFVRADVSSAEDVANLVARTVAEFGQVDVLVNNAGIGQLIPSHEQDLDGWRKTLAVNLDGCFLMAQAVIRQMLTQSGSKGLHGDIQRGAIVNVASVHGLVGFPQHAAYTASKGAVVNLTRSLGIEYAKQGIRVNAVCPGFILTPLISAGVSDVLMPQIKAMHPIGRLGSSEEVAAPIVFLVSDEASFITGTHIAIDGGYTAQ